MTKTRHFIVLIAVLMITGCSTGSGGIGTGEFTSFRDGVFRIELTQDDIEHQPPRLNTRRDAISTAPYLTPIPGHYGRSWVMMKTSAKDTILSYAIVSWNDENPADYLSAGWWTHFEDQQYPNLNLFGPSYTYIFIDGPELNPAYPSNLPVVGSASYSGKSGGAFGYQYGNQWGNYAGKLSFDEFEANASITLDFENQTVSGCIGCEGDITVKREHLKELYDKLLSDKVVDSMVSIKDYEIHFAPTKIPPNRYYESSGVTSIKHPEKTITMLTVCRT